MRKSPFLMRIWQNRYAWLGALILIGLAGLGVLFTLSNDSTSNLVRETAVGDAWLEVYFSEPDDPEAASYRSGPDEALSQAIDDARYSVDVAALDLDLWSIRDALIWAHQRGVVVRVVVESDNYQVDEIQDLVAAGIQVVQDQRPSLMHHKFVVIDRVEVWTGSMNFTVNGAYRNDNNLVHVRSLNLARDYTREFEEMFIDDRFGAMSLDDTPYPRIEVEGVLIEAWFSPDDGAASRLVEVIGQAEAEIRIMAFAFTSDPLAEALIERAEAGVEVAMVIESGQAGNVGSDIERLRQAGINVYLDGNPNNMHHKVIIIDDQVVITGSYNFSRNAEEFNDENLLIIYDPGLAARFLLEWERVFSQAVP